MFKKIKDYLIEVISTIIEYIYNAFGGGGGYA